MEVDFEDVLSMASEGNTGTDSSEAPRAKRSLDNQYKYWCGTHHIQFEAYDSKFKDFIQKQPQYIFGMEECPTTGKKHWQFYFESINKKGIRLSKLHKDHPKTHFEKCKADKIKNFTYCSKSGSYMTNIMDVYIPKLTFDMLYPWQKEIVNIISSVSDERTIHWYWEPTGNVGKTTFSKYLSFYHNAIPLEGKKNDILYCAAVFPSMLYIYDIERSLEEHLSYGAIEKIKNGYYMCAKYESKPVIRNPPHLFIFANFKPDASKLSEDRWNIVKI